jgi:hypothetical protein
MEPTVSGDPHHGAFYDQAPGPSRELRGIRNTAAWPAIGRDLDGNRADSGMPESA